MGRIVLPVYTPHYIPNGNEVAVIETSRGTIRVQLAGKDAPVTAGNFIELAARGFYDKLKFHAHKPGSVVLGGCPTTRTLGPAQVDAAARGMIRGIHPAQATRATPSWTSGRPTEQQARAGKPLHGAQVRAELG